jgi:hypothetical protein
MRRRTALISACAYGGCAALLAFVSLWLSSNALDSQPSPWYEAIPDAALFFGLPAAFWGGFVGSTFRMTGTESGKGSERGALVAVLTAITAGVFISLGQPLSHAFSWLVVAVVLAAIASPFGAGVGLILSRCSTRTA